MKDAWRVMGTGGGALAVAVSCFLAGMMVRNLADPRSELVELRDYASAMLLPTTVCVIGESDHLHNPQNLRDEAIRRSIEDVSVADDQNALIVLDERRVRVLRFTTSEFKFTDFGCRSP